MVSRASLHNFDLVAERDIRVGDRVVVKRAGDVIPYVSGPLVDVRTGDETPITPPTHCPSCDEEVVHPEGEIAYYCINAECPAQLVQKLTYFAHLMDIDGLGEQTAVQLVNAGLIHNPADLYALTKNDLLQLEGFADKKAENLLDSIVSSKEVPLTRLLAALGIRGVGGTVAALLTDVFPSLEALATATEEEIVAIEGLGPITARNIKDWLSRPRHREMVQQLTDAGLTVEAPATEEDQQGETLLDGLTFVITGTLSQPRGEVRRLIESHGGKVTGSVSGRTNYLIVGEDPGGSKYNRAQELDTPMLSEDELRDLIGL
jgi:DNA ligase (NAD+)